MSLQESLCMLRPSAGLFFRAILTLDLKIRPCLQLVDETMASAAMYMNETAAPRFDVLDVILCTLRCITVNPKNRFLSLYTQPSGTAVLGLEARQLDILLRTISPKLKKMIPVSHYKTSRHYMYETLSIHPSPGRLNSLSIHH